MKKIIDKKISNYFNNMLLENTNFLLLDNYKH